MASRFTICDGCRRHVDSGAHACPFCGVARATMALLAAVAIGSAACGKADDDAPPRRDPAHTTTTSEPTAPVVPTSTTPPPSPTPTKTAPLVVVAYGPPPIMPTGPALPAAAPVVIDPTGDKDVDAVLARNRFRFQACAAKAIAADPTAAHGTVTTLVTVDGGGNVTDVTTTAATSSTTVDQCFRDALYATHFPERAGKYAVRVRLAAK